MPPQTKKKRDLTTIALHRDTKKVLDSLKKGTKDCPEKVIQRLIHGITDVYVELVLVDNELPQTHTVVFQLGTDKESLYYWNGQSIVPITLAQVQKLLKQPKPDLKKGDSR